MSYATYEQFLERDLHEYAGKWVAMLNSKVIASGKDVNKVIDEFKRKYPKKTPFVTKVRMKLSVLSQSGTSIYNRRPNYLTSP